MVYIYMYSVVISVHKEICSVLMSTEVFLSQTYLSWVCPLLFHLILTQDTHTVFQHDCAAPFDCSEVTISNGHVHRCD